MLKQLIGIAGGGLVLLTLMGKLGFDTKKFLNLNSFAKDADFRLKSIHGLKVVGGITGTANFLVDIDVINKSTGDILLSNLLVTAYNEKGEFIGESAPYTQKVIIKESATTIIPNINLSVKFSSALFDYTLPMLLEVIKNKTWRNVNLGKTIKLNVAMELNGIKVAKNVSYKI